jgi:hypothetical protein
MDKTTKTVDKIKEFARPTIQVTQQEIDDGLRENSRHCMIAEAVKHSIPNAKTVSVDLATIRFTNKRTGERFTYMTPYLAQQALVKFDNGEKPEPFKFQLRTLFQIRPKSTIHRRTATPATVAVVRHGEKESGTRRAPIKIGGQPAPKSVLGTIRRFGLHTLPGGSPAAKTQKPIPIETPNA